MQSPVIAGSGAQAGSCAPRQGDPDSSANLSHTPRQDSQSASTRCCGANVLLPSRMTEALAAMGCRFVNLCSTPAPHLSWSSRNTLQLLSALTEAARALQRAALRASEAQVHKVSTLRTSQGAVSASV